MDISRQAGTATTIVEASLEIAYKTSLPGTPRLLKTPPPTPKSWDYTHPAWWTAQGTLETATRGSRDPSETC